jgi:hypothetical protein
VKFDVSLLTSSLFVTPLNPNNNEKKYALKIARTNIKIYEIEFLLFIPINSVFMSAMKTKTIAKTTSIKKTEIKYLPFLSNDSKSFLKVNGIK